MQADPAFAASIQAGDARTVAATGLAEDELGLLRHLDPAAVSADPGGKRRTQIAGNAASEFVLTLAAASRHADDLLEGFLTSPEFHAAIANDGRLPLAFADHAARCAKAWDDPPLRGVLALERALVELRREAQRFAPTIPSPHPPMGEPTPGDRHPRAPVSEKPADGEIFLAPTARLVRLPRGTFEATQALRAALDAGRELPPLPGTEPDAGPETVLCFARPPFSAHRLPEVHAELLAPPTDTLFERARVPLSREARAALAAEHGAAPEDLEALLAGFVEEGALLRG